ncbi:MAG: mercuric transporter MerT family protein [Myxococcota bacterium]
MSTRKDNGAPSKSALFGSVGAAIAAAVCCLGPLLLVSLGATGAWIGHLSAFEPFRPLFAVIAAGFLGYGFFRVYGRSQQADCGEGAECEVPRAGRINRVSLWVATVVVVGLFASPYILDVGPGDASAASTPAEAATPEAQDDTSRLDVAVLTVEGMTCEGCTTTVATTLERLDGVQKAVVSLEPPRARVTYAPARISVEELTEATADVGYPTTPKN